MDNAFTGHALHHRGLCERVDRILPTSASSMKPPEEVWSPTRYSLGCHIHSVSVPISFGVYEVIPVMPPLHVVLFLEVLPVLFAVRKTQNAVVETFLLACTPV